MCFKKRPKLPEPTPEDKALEEEMKALRAAQKRELAYEMREEKDAQTEAAYARSLGFIGNRSLITGPKGGAGYMGAGSGRVATAGSGGGGSGNGITPSAPPLAGGRTGGFGGGGIYGFGTGDFTLITRGSRPGALGESVELR